MFVFYAWLWNRTGGSILIAILVHGVMDAYPNFILFPMFPKLGEMTDSGVLTVYLANIVGYGAAAIVIAFATRGRLGAGRDVRADGATGARRAE